MQVTLSGSRDEGVQQYRALLDPSLQDQPLPKAQQPATYDEEVEGSSPQGKTFLVVINTSTLPHAKGGSATSLRTPSRETFSG